MDRLQDNIYQEENSSFLNFLLKGLNVFFNSTVVYDLYNKTVTINYQNHTYTYDYK